MTGAGCSLFANARQTPGRAVALPCKPVACSVAPAPTECRRGTQQKPKHIPSPRHAPFVGGLPVRPPCRAGWGAVLPRAGVGAPCRFAPDDARRLALRVSLPLWAPVSSVVRRLRGTTPPAVRLRGRAALAPLAKRLRAHGVAWACVPFVSGPAGLFAPVPSRALLPVLCREVRA